MFLRSYTFVIYQDRPSDTLGPSVGSEAKAILCCNTTLSKEKDEARGYCGNWPWAWCRSHQTPVIPVARCYRTRCTSIYSSQNGNESELHRSPAARSVHFTSIFNLLWCQAGVMKWTPKALGWQGSLSCFPPPWLITVLSCSVTDHFNAEVVLEFLTSQTGLLQGNSSEAPIVVAARKVGLSENIAGSSKWEGIGAELVQTDSLSKITAPTLFLVRISVIIWVLANLWALGWHLHPKIKVHLVHHQSTLPIRVCLWGWARSCKHLYLVQVNSCGMHSWWSVLVGCLWGSPLAFRGDYPRVLEVPFSSSRKMMLLVWFSLVQFGCHKATGRRHISALRPVRLTVSKVGGTHLCDGGMPLPAGWTSQLRAPNWLRLVHLKSYNPLRRDQDDHGLLQATILSRAAQGLLERLKSILFDSYSSKELRWGDKYLQLQAFWWVLLCWKRLQAQTTWLFAREQGPQSICWTEHRDCTMRSKSTSISSTDSARLSVCPPSLISLSLRVAQAPNYIIDLCCEQLKADGSVSAAMPKG